MRQMIRQVAATFADHISECSDSAEAVAAYTTEQLMDVRMPRLNGIQATRQIRAAFPAALIIIVTSFDEPGLREAAQQAGACGYVLKENLLELREWFQRTN